MPRNGAFVLADFVGVLPHVEIRCERCARYGKWRTQKLADRFGPDAPFPGLLTMLPEEGGCERARRLGSTHDRCEAKFMPQTVDAFRRFYRAPLN